MTHKRSPDIAKQVAAMVMAGITQDQISEVVGIARNTLRKYYAKEIKNSKAKMITNVAGKLYENAMAGKEASIFFLLKTQAGYKERQVIEHDGNLDLSIDKNRQSVVQRFLERKQKDED